MGVIRRLPDDLANQIAAGEVVERPASVVKELIENAADAGATRVRIETEGGGVGLVRVSDDGVGMTAEDALLALERHATSKIAALDDLRRIATYGFRGEALPSIASVSRFSLRSRRHDDEAGIEVSVSGGGAPQSKPCGAANGTTIDVRDLFFNVPARRKFLRSTATESAHVTDVAIAAALARPELGVTLVRDGRTVKEWLRAKTREERVTSSYGEEGLACCRGERGPLRVEAFLGKPEKARASAASLLLFVNGRVIRDRALLRAVAQAYGSVLEPGRYPNGVVYLDLDPELIDVNVHPQKAEVRFADGRAVGDALFRILAEELARAFGTPLATRGRTQGTALGSSSSPPPRADAEVRRPDPGPSAYGGGSRPPRATAGRDPWADAPPEPWVFQPAASHAARSAETTISDEGAEAQPVVEGVSQTRAEEHAGAGAPVDRASDAPEAAREPSGTEQPRLATAALDATVARRPARDAEQSEVANPTAVASSTAVPSLPYPIPSAGLNELREAFGGLRFVSQVRHTYLVCEGESGLYVLDQHASAERVAFDRLRKAYLGRTVAIQTLLFPAAVEVTMQEAILVEEQHDDLLGAGLDVRIAGPTTVAVYGMPRVLVRAKPEDLVRDLLAELMRTSSRTFSSAVDLVLATMACHGSIRAGDRISPEEASALLTALDHVDFAGHCPHGRPIITRLSWDELERKVGRR